MRGKQKSTEMEENQSLSSGNIQFSAAGQWEQCTWIYKKGCLCVSTSSGPHLSAKECPRADPCGSCGREGRDKGLYQAQVLPDPP